VLELVEAPNASTTITKSIAFTFVKSASSAAPDARFAFAPIAAADTRGVIGTARTIQRLTIVLRCWGVGARMPAFESAVMARPWDP
jgi:hypothetical protein